MSTTQAPAPTLHNVGTKPRISRKLFVSVPVNDLQRSIEFFEALGFTFNQQFTDATATCMLVGEDAYFILLTREKFASFTKRPIGDARKAVSVGLSISAESREEVNEIVKKAITAGGTEAMGPEDHGFMYSWDFFDLDGNQWGIFWMDPAAIAG
jgi:predicted lactoylglutathione lyase